MCEREVFQYFKKSRMVKSESKNLDNYNFRHYVYIQDVPRRKVNILEGHSIGHSKQKCLYEHVSYSERFPR